MNGLIEKPSCAGNAHENFDRHKDAQCGDKFDKSIGIGKLPELDIEAAKVVRAKTDILDCIVDDGDDVCVFLAGSACARARACTAGSGGTRDDAGERRRGAWIETLTG